MAILGIFVPGNAYVLATLFWVRFFMSLRIPWINDSLLKGESGTGKMKLSINDLTSSVFYFLQSSKAKLALSSKHIYMIS